VIPDGNAFYLIPLLVLQELQTISYFFLLGVSTITI
jgi:hypothetical protein